ncbi:MAG: MATE family efflux transporter [Acidobacteria bacterium RIFCSPLOWO2_02_FULL_65_29]|nr:MAG: MATE family efflux transporter [Acidobacteria bacterium RIFCSPLOWO2_02_FULL_65_29]
MDASAVPVQASPSIWATLREAVRGSRQDLTEAPIGRAVVLLAVPMVLEMFMESVFAVADVFFVGRLGADAVATVGITESLMTVIYAVAIGLSIGATATVARRIGERDPARAARAAGQSIVLGLAGAAAIGTAGAVFAPDLLRVMGASDSVIRTGSGFARVMLGGSGTVLLLFLVNAIFRGAGDAAIAMRVLWFANAINIALGPCLIFGLGPFPEMGVTGAAVATTIGRGSGVLFQIYLLTRGGSRIALRRSHLRTDRQVLAGILRLSGVGMFQNFIGTASWMGLIRILTGFGSAAVAGNTIGIRIIIFALLPSFGVSNAAATLVGQNLGAGKPDRAEAAVWRAGFYNTVALSVVGLVFLVFARPLIGIFSSDPEVVPYGVRCLRIVSAGFLFYGYGMVLTQSFNGAGDTRTPTLINLVCLWMLEIPLAWVLAYPLGLGPTGVFTSVSVAFSVLALVSAVIFKQGRWKTQKV